MTAKSHRIGYTDTARRAFAACLVVLGIAAATPANAIEPLKVVLDQASILKLPEGTSTVVVGNPLIADVAIQSGGLVVVTGKGYGATNLVALDRAGATLMERELQVRGGGDNTVFVYRGAERESGLPRGDRIRIVPQGDELGGRFGLGLADRPRHLGGQARPHRHEAPQCRAPGRTADPGDRPQRVSPGALSRTVASVRSSSG